MSEYDHDHSDDQKYEKEGTQGIFCQLISHLMSTVCITDMRESFRLILTLSERKH